MVYLSYKKEVKYARLLCKVPIQEGNEELERDYHEEWQTGDPGDLPDLRDQDVPYRKRLVFS
jgi:hypothetical protein